MSEHKPRNPGKVIKRIRQQAAEDRLRVTAHAQQEMVEDGFTLAEVLEAIIDGEVIEDYPEHKRGPCCLISGRTNGGRNVHVVCATSLEVLVVITVYEPKPPKWATPSNRGEKL